VAIKFVRLEHKLVCRRILMKSIQMYNQPFQDQSRTRSSSLSYSCLYRYEVCSKSIQVGIVVDVQWGGCVCNQSWHARTRLSNSWHKLQVAAFAQLAVVGRGSNTCVYVIAIFTLCESTEQRICKNVFLLNRKTRNGNVSIIAASIRWRCTGSYTSVWLVPSI